MGLRSAPRTILRFVAVVAGLYFSLALALLLLVVAVRTVAGNYPVPDGVGESAGTLSLPLSVLLGAWFLVEEYSLRHLLAFAASLYVIFFLPLIVAAAVDAVFGPVFIGWTGSGALLVGAGVFAYLGAYRLVYPSSFAERARRLGLGN